MEGVTDARIGFCGGSNGGGMGSSVSTAYVLREESCDEFLSAVVPVAPLESEFVESCSDGG